MIWLFVSIHLKVVVKGMNKDECPLLALQVCFHCQQSAEKYLNVLLEELDVAVPKTHDLDDLLVRLLPHYPSLNANRRGLRFLTGFAVDPRYPLLRTSKRQAASALRRADKVRKACRNLLGLQTDKRP
jgi:HEPN domain-containing protein